MARTAIATDAFTYADGNLDTVSANWTNVANNSGHIVVATNKIAPGYTNMAEARWSGAGTYTNDQYSSIVLGGSGADVMGVIARSTGLETALTRKHYRAYLDRNNNTFTLDKVLGNGSSEPVTSLGTDTSQTWSAGDRIECECEGTTIRALRNGTAIITVTDATITTGTPGVCDKQFGTGVTGDDWEGGNLTSGGIVEEDSEWIQFIQAA